MRTWIKSPLAVFGAAQQEAGGGVVIDGARIAELVAPGASPREPAERVFDASAHVLLPGLINTHHHFYQTLTRALPAALDKPLFAWLRSLYPVWANLDDEMIDLATRLAAAELLLSGCTTSADHHYLYTAASQRALDVQAGAIKDAGIRATLTRGSMSLGREQGGLPPQSTVQDEDAILADCARVIDAHHDASRGAMLQVALAPCSPFSVSMQLMRDTAELAREKKARLHTHLAETEDETRFCREKFGVRPLEYLEQAGWLNGNNGKSGGDVWLAHGVHFDAGEIARLGAAGAGICHCPSSNMLLGSGQCPALDLERAGCPLGLGVDGSASNDCSNMMAEVRQAFLLQRLRYGAGEVSHLDALRWATAGSAACLGRDDIGRLARDCQADFALFNLDAERFSGAADPLAALVLCGADRADYVMVAGEWKVERGEIPGLDLPQLRARHGAAAARLRGA